MRVIDILVRPTGKERLPLDIVERCQITVSLPKG